MFSNVCRDFVLNRALYVLLAYYTVIQIIFLIVRFARD